MNRYLFAILGGPALACASIYQNTLTSVLLGWFVALLFALQAKRKGLDYLSVFILGVIFHLISVPWLVSTMEIFGGLNTVVASFVFLGYCLLSSIQFLLIAFLYKRLLPRISILALPLAWITADFLIPKLFPWQLTYSQLWFTAFAGNAEYFGSPVLSFIMMLLAVLLLEKPKTAVSSFICLTLFGHLLNNRALTDIDSAKKIKIALLQGNVSLDDKASAAKFSENIELYREMSDKAFVAGADLVVWPESVINRPFELTQITQAKELPVLKNQPGDLLLGILTATDAGLQNSAIGLNPEGKYAGVYHKQVLMPFGEYLPLENYFPSLRELSPNTGNFLAGKEQPAISFDSGVKAALLICYEDMLPSVSFVDSNVLINITNDAWYGLSNAPYQHHLLASFRAIENRKFLLRSTNTGYTVILDSLGRVVSDAEIFVKKTVDAEVPLLERETVINSTRDLLSKILVLGSLLVICLKRRL